MASESVNKIREYYMTVAVTVIMAGVGYIMNKMDAQDTKINIIDNRLIIIEEHDRLNTQRINIIESDLKKAHEENTRLEAILPENKYHLKNGAND